MTTYVVGSGTLDGLQYHRDANRNVTQRNDAGGSTTSLQDFTYDSLNRLQTWKLSPGVTTTFAYNKMGNLLTESTNGTPGSTITYRYGEEGAPLHALTSRNGARYTYDAAGRQSSGPDRLVNYNRFGLPTQLRRDNGVTTDFGYGASGERIIKRDPSETVISLGGVFERRIGTNIKNVHYILADGRPVAQVTRTQTTPNVPSTDPETLYLHSDGYNIVQTTRQNGQVAEEFFYDPFGRRTNNRYEPLPAQRPNIRLGYTAHAHDDELGLINMKDASTIP